jgi:hypothetical protein
MVHGLCCSNADKLWEITPSYAALLTLHNGHHKVIVSYSSHHLVSCVCTFGLFGRGIQMYHLLLRVSSIPLLSGT